MPRTLILRTDHLGDAILTTPLIRALAKAGHEVDFILPQVFLPLFVGNPHLRECLGIEEVVSDWRRQWLCLARWIGARHYDVLILPMARPWQLLLASLLSGTPVRIAMWGGIAGRLTLHRCLRSGILTAPRYMGDILLDCARALGVPDDGIVPEIVSGGEARSLGPGRPRRVGLHPGCAGNTCNFSPVGYEEIARLILERTDWEIVLTGSAEERQLLAQWERGILDSPRVRNTLGTCSLPELAELLRTLDLFISTGTGPHHMATALDVPTMTPFCSAPSISRRAWGNPRPNGHALEAKAEQCRGKVHHCDFSGKISPHQFFERCMTAMEEIRASSSA